MVWDPSLAPKRKRPARKRRWQKKRPNSAAVLGGGGGGAGTDVSRLAPRRRRRRSRKVVRRLWWRGGVVLAVFLDLPGWVEPMRGTAWAEPGRGVNWEVGAMNILVKRANESRAYTMDFGNQPEVQGGQTLSAPSVTATPAGLTVSGAAVSGNKVQATVAGGTDGVLYTLSFQCGTSGGATLVGIGYLMVDDQ